MDKQERNFRTRLEYLREIWTHPYSEEEILKLSIEHRLGRSFEAYVEEVNNSLVILSTKNPVTVLKKIEKGDQ